MRIAVATTNYYGVTLPAGYAYLEVGCALRKSHQDGMLHDDDGENISTRNDCYCELTALYWLWRNDPDKIRGLCHYRRFLSADRSIGAFPVQFYQEANISGQMLTQNEVDTLLADHDIILTIPYDPADHSVREDLGLYVSQRDIATLDQLMHEQGQEWEQAYQEVMASFNISYCNMMVAGRRVYDDYCSWLFDVLAQYEQRVDLTGYTPQQRRIYGYVSEVLLNVYVQRHHLRAAYVNMLAVRECYHEGTESSYMSLQHLVARNALVRGIYSLYCRLRYPMRWSNLQELRRQLEKES